MILFIETYNIVHERVNFTICKLYVNESDSQKRQRVKNH